MNHKSPITSHTSLLFDICPKVEQNKRIGLMRNKTRICCKKKKTKNGEKHDRYRFVCHSFT